MTVKGSTGGAGRPTAIRRRHPPNAGPAHFLLVLMLCAGCDADRLRPVADPAAQPAPLDPCALATPKDCTDVLGACGGPTESFCSDGWWTCLDTTPPAPETCNDRDDDCDGQTDEGLFADCYDGPPWTIGVGACAAGISRCGDNRCYFSVLPSAEICDGIDNDCDGLVDEGVTAIPGCCSPPEPEICDGLDNDCNGAIDEGVLDACGHCLGEEPDEIPCNGIDDNCDGRTDENSPLAVIEIGIAVDASVSNADALPGQKAALQAAVRDLGALFPCARWDLLVFPTNQNGIGGSEIYASNASAQDADAALAKLAPGGGYIEPSYDVLVDMAPAHAVLAIRSLVLVEDEAGQSLTGLSEPQCAAALTALHVQVLTFTDAPWTFGLLGPVRPLGSDIRADMVAFVRARAGL